MTGPNDPVRLADILPLAFPHGGMTVSGLRREAQRGRLDIMRIAGKDFTTLSAIEEMKRKCVVAPSLQEQPAQQKQDVALDAAYMVVKRLKSGKRS